MIKKFGLIIALFCAYVSSSYGMTVQDIVDRVRVNIKDQGTSGNRLQFTDATLLNYLNDGQRETNLQAWLLTGKVSITLVSGTREYSLPTDFISTDRVIHNGIRLSQTNFNELDQTSSWTNSTSATPQKYYIYFTTNSTIGFHPKPSTPTVTNVDIYYVKQPIELTSTSETPWNGYATLVPYHSALVYYVTFRAYMAIEEPTLAQSYYQEWVNMVQVMRNGTTRMPDFNPAFQGQRK